MQLWCLSAKKVAASRLVFRFQLLSKGGNESFFMALSATKSKWIEPTISLGEIAMLFFAVLRPMSHVADTTAREIRASKCCAPLL